MKNIVIISSNYTGHGHKSISEALQEQFNLHKDVNINIIDGFDLAGNMGVQVGKSYGLVTRNAKKLWNLAWKFSNRNLYVMHEFIELSVKHNFLKLLKKLKPDLILCVHPIFNTPIINILKEYRINIPFVTFVADLVSISPLWADKRAKCIICPTEEAKERCIGFGVAEKSIKVFGFPVRKRFTRHISQKASKPSYVLDKPLQCLVISGGEGSGDMGSIAKTLLDNFNCNVNIIAGRNKSLKVKLEKTLSLQYPDRINILGYTSNIEEYMLASDIAFTRGSPNVMMEAVACNVPLIITGALPGQEQENPEFAESNNLGIVCNDISNLYEIVSELLADNGKKLNAIKQAQQQFFDHNSAQKIVEYILSIVSNSAFKYPSEFRPRRKSIRLALK
jgi:UDP-N-acetylglucosamine:LPS N-acetylglucosamine transferase